MSVFDDIAAERQRQIKDYGWSPRHDDRHDQGELASAAACYALSSDQRWMLDDRYKEPFARRIWPWNPEDFRPRGRREELIIASALLVAEIERFDRISENSPARSERL